MPGEELVLSNTFAIGIKNDQPTPEATTSDYLPMKTPWLRSFRPCDLKMVDIFDDSSSIPMIFLFDATHSFYFSAGE